MTGIRSARAFRMAAAFLLVLTVTVSPACDSGGANEQDEEQQEEGFPDPPGRPGNSSASQSTNEGHAASALQFIYNEAAPVRLSMEMNIA